MMLDFSPDQSCATMHSSKGLFSGLIAAQQQQTSALLFEWADTTTQMSNF